MPVYNAERYLAAAVESILAQSFRDFEFLIINDGSTDDSQAILERYAVADPRIRLVSRENRGLVATLNEMIGLAKGDLLARMDADDVALPDRFEIQMAYLREHPEVVCLAGDCQAIDEHGWYLFDFKRPSGNAAIQERMLIGDNCIMHPSVILRRSAVLAVGGYCEDVKWAEDLDLWLKLGEIGEIAVVDHQVLKYRIHSDSIGAKYQDTQRISVELACTRAAQRRGIASKYQPAPPYRPTNRTELYTQSVGHGWIGHSQRNRPMALHYAWKSIRLIPWKPDAWRLLAFTLARA
jgi:glycosyltransferase involved in cell wall biosynthesis